MTRIESELTFRFHNRQDGSVRLLPISHATLADPKFTVGILNTAIYENPVMARFSSLSKTQTYHHLLRYAISPDDKEFSCKLSAGELINMTDTDLQEAGLFGKYLEIFRTATQAIRQRFTSEITT